MEKFAYAVYYSSVLLRYIQVFKQKKKVGKPSCMKACLLAASSYVQICYVRRPSASERFQDSFHDPCLCSGQDEQPNGAPLQRTSCNQQQMTSMS